jgi:hypothetical protein
VSDQTAQPGVYAPVVAADARDRALRTLVQGLAANVLIAVVAAVGPALSGSNFAWSRTYWATVGTLAASTAVTAAGSYLMRRLVPPAPELRPAGELGAGGRPPR